VVTFRGQLGANPNGSWAIEQVDDNDYYCFGIENVLYSGRTWVQRVEIVETDSYGVALLLDGRVQSAQDDEYVYHEALVHPAMLAHPRPSRALIIGGGEGATLREVLAHRTIQRATMVDIDPGLVAVCRHFLGSWHQGAFDDPRAELVFSCGRAYLERTRETFDVAIIDLTDFIDASPVFNLYTRQFYQLLKRHLRPGGIVVVQGLEFSSSDWAQHAALSRTLGAVFPIVRSYRAYVPSFACTWGFLTASSDVDPASKNPSLIDRRVAERLTRRLRSYDGLAHQALFTMPKDLRDLLARAGPILEDGKPEVLAELFAEEDVVEPGLEPPARAPVLAS